MGTKIASDIDETKSFQGLPTLGQKASMEKASMDKDVFLHEIERNPFKPAQARGNSGDPKTPTTKEKILPEIPETFFLPSFFVELVQRIKDLVGSIKTYTHISKDKMHNLEFKEYFFKIINEDINDIDSVLNSLITYIRINTPIVKANTVHAALEDILKKSESQIAGKKIRVIQKFEKNLPETIVHEEQMKYILNSLVDYAINRTLYEGSIGLLTKSFDVPKDADETRKGTSREGRYVEIVVIFSGSRKSADQFDSVMGSPNGTQRDESADLTLLLVKEIIRKNQGEMRVEVDEKKPKTIISIAFPVERRKVVSYPALDL